MISKIEKAIKQYNMIEKGDKILVAFSGGADSVTLLHYLCMNREKYGITVAAAHVNHQLRGEESDRDEQFCYDFCEALNIPLYIKAVDISALAAKQKLSTETCARNVRYDFFKEITGNSGNYKTATAHTLSDCCETLILNLTRGSSLAGLCSIPPKRDNIIRPLIDCTRDDIENYISHNYLQYVTDSTNLSNDYTRNIIRHEIIPVLKQINSRAEQNFGKAISSIRLDEEHLNSAAQTAFDDCLCENGFDSKKIKALPDSIRYRVIKKLLSKAGSEISNELIMSVDEAIAEKKSTNLPCGKKLTAKGGIITVTEQKQTAPIKNCDEITISPNDSIIFINKKVSFTFANDTYAQNINKKFVNNYLDYDKIEGTTYIRTRRDGDSFSPAHRKVTKSLKKLFNEMKLDLSERDTLILLCDDKGIIFIEGIGCCERVKISSDSKNICKLDIEALQVDLSCLN